MKPQVAEVLGAVADGILPLHEAGAEEVLGDALRLLGSKEIKVRDIMQGCFRYLLYFSTHCEAAPAIPYQHTEARSDVSRDSDLKNLQVNRAPMEIPVSEHGHSRSWAFRIGLAKPCAPTLYDQLV